MIIILTNQDLKDESGLVPQHLLRDSHLRSYVQSAASYAEDVYFWRDGIATAMKRRNAPLEVPNWLHGLTGVDR